MTKAKRLNDCFSVVLLYAGFICLSVACGGNHGHSDKTDKTDKVDMTVMTDKMDWNIFRGNPSLSGYTDICLPENPLLLWTYKSETRTISSPVVNKGTTYWSDRRGRILGVDINGRLCFEYDLKTAVDATPMIFDSTLYIGRIDGIMTAISLEKEDTVWTFESMGQISASPNCIDFTGRQAIVFGSYDNFLYCVDVKDGSLINHFESGYYLNGAVALQNRHVIFGGCDAWLRIINCETGVSTDSLLLNDYIPASPAIHGDYCYVGDYSGNIYELLLEKGKIVHHKKIMESTDESGLFVSVPAITATTVFFLTNNRYLYAVERKTGSVSWKYMLKGNAGESSPVVCKDKLIVCTKTGIITILDVESGKPEWEYDTGEQITGSPAVVENHFMVLTDRGTLFCFGSKSDNAPQTDVEEQPLDGANDAFEYVNKEFLLGKIEQRHNSPLFVKVEEEHTERNIYILHPVYEAYKKMYEAALTDSVKLIITSGHRYFYEQVYEWELRWDNPRTDSIFANDVEKAKYVLQYRSMPGTTRHHWGTDIDLNSFELAYYESKEGQKVYNWLKENAKTYGFYQPYTALNENRPFGYQEEKWHWSYKPLSRFMLTRYLALVSIDDIIGFEGDEAAKELPIISEWVRGINPEIMKAD